MKTTIAIVFLFTGAGSALGQSGVSTQRDMYGEFAPGWRQLFVTRCQSGTAKQWSSQKHADATCDRKRRQTSRAQGK